MDGPENDEWWMAVVCDPDSGEVFGDVGTRLSWKGRSAEVGYTFAKEHWGKGYAAEALEALAQYLFDVHDVTRSSACFTPTTRPRPWSWSERTLFEGETKSSFWVGDEVSDDWIYGMTRPDWETWRNRPRHPPDSVHLVEVTTENVATVSGLTTHRTQQEFVAPMLQSFADALFPEVVDEAPVVPWMRAVVADDVIVGFVMLALSTEHHPEPFLWRLLIDRLHQRRGIGARILESSRPNAWRWATRASHQLGEGKGSPGLSTWLTASSPPAGWSMTRPKGANGLAAPVDGDST